jgi:hypothetical protein
VRVFGPSHVLAVSNSAGTRDDPAQLQAESVSYYLTALRIHARSQHVSLHIFHFFDSPARLGSSLGGAGAGPDASVEEGSESTGTPLAVWTRESMAMRWAEK